jgi:serine/threonine protein kinase
MKMDGNDEPGQWDTLDKQLTAGPDKSIVLARRYRVVRKLGEGGMGTVWLAEDIKLDDRPVAIKMLPAILSSNPRGIRQLKQEAKLAMHLSHPNIVTLRAFEEEDGSAFLVMDYVEGQTLEQLLAEKETLPEDEVIRLFTPIAEALDYAHSQKVVHRDIKPSNILIRKDGTPFITDFGVAREMKDSMTRVTGKSTSGTLPYMSPEQLRGEAPAPAQDVYSLAATMYECLSGNPPFYRGQIEYQIVNEQPPALMTKKKLCKGILAALNKDPSTRPRRSNEIWSPPTKRQATVATVHEAPPPAAASAPPELAMLKMAIKTGSRDNVDRLLVGLRSPQTSVPALQAAVSLHNSIPREYDDILYPFLIFVMRAKDVPPEVLLDVADALSIRDRVTEAKEAAEKALGQAPQSERAENLISRLYARDTQLQKQKQVEQDRARIAKERREKETARKAWKTKHAHGLAMVWGFIPSAILSLVLYNWMLRNTAITGDPVSKYGMFATGFMLGPFAAASTQVGWIVRCALTADEKWHKDLMIKVFASPLTAMLFFPFIGWLVARLSWHTGLSVSTIVAGWVGLWWGSHFTK